MSSGQELLLQALARGERRESSLTGEPSPGDWADLLLIATPGLHPYLAWRLPQLIDWQRITPEVRHALTLAQRGATIGYLRRQSLLRRAADALNGAGVPFVVLKGMVLAHLAYPDPSLRPMGDLDLWIRPEFLDTGAAALIAAGLRYPPEREARTRAAHLAELESTRLLELHETGGRLALELHSVVKSMAAVAPAWAGAAWERTVTARLGGVEVRVLHSEDMLTHLAVHCSEHHHFTMGLRPLLDIALWLEARGTELDWSRMAERWQVDGGATWIVLTLALTRELLGASIPATYSGEALAAAGLTPVYQLARNQVLGAHRTLPQQTLAKVSAERSLAGRARWLGYRLTGWYWQGPPGVSRSAREATTEALRRMGHDLRYKLPPYLNGFVTGSLRGAELRRRQEPAVERERLAAMVNEMEGRSREDPRLKPP